MTQNLYPISIMPEAEFALVKERELIVPIDSGPGLRVVDCGDRRPLTPETVAKREGYYGTHIHPGRYFGGAAGLAATAVLAGSVLAGSDIINSLPHSPDVGGFADFAADIATRAHVRETGTGPVDIHNHSSTTFEGNPLRFDANQDGWKGFDCAFATHLGTIAQIAATTDVLAEANSILSETGLDLPVQAVSEGAQQISSMLPHDLTIHRGVILRARGDRAFRTPLAVLDGTAEPTGQVRVIYDLAGFRSDATAHHSANKPWYHHTPEIARRELPVLLPEFSLDPDIVAASALLMGVATRQALEHMKGHALPAYILPPEFSQAA